ncbi:CRTAC1 family protein [Singulisphaera rosea]
MRRAPFITHLVSPLGWIILGLLLSGCEQTVSPSPPTPKTTASTSVRPVSGRDLGLSDRMAFMAFADAYATIPKDPSPFRFSEIHESSHIHFVHTSGTTEDRLFPTAFGSGVAFLDFDGDGRLDLYFANATFLPLGKAETGPNRLYKNLGGGQFRDVTEASGLGFRGFCSGIVVGDIDNDGDPDVFLCNCGPGALFLNNGDGTFADISKASGVDRTAWSSGGAMLDYDNDGDLDVYVANYGEWDYLKSPHHCGTKEQPVYCSPGSIPSAKHILYRNNGNGTFTDVTDAAGVGRVDGRGFGVIAADFNLDGRIDLFVANDLRPNFLFLNKGDGTFEDATETSGAAYNAQGTAQSSMGADAEDIDGDGRPEILVTNFQYEYSTLYQNLPGSGATTPGAVPPVTFLDHSANVGLVADSRPYVGWGCALADFDNDGWPDAFVTNGHLDSNRNRLGPTLSYLEPPMLHRNVPGSTTGSGTRSQTRRFQLATKDVGPYFASRHSGRGAAFGDFDDDGDIDIIINHRDDAPAVLRNDTPGSSRWIRFNLVGTRSNRDAIGTRVDVQVGDRTIVRQKKGGCSMQSTNDPRLLIGLGVVDSVARAELHWPSGTVSTLTGLETNTTYEVVEPRHDGGVPEVRVVPTNTRKSE